MSEIRRGDIFRAKLAEGDGRVVVVSRDAINAWHNEIVVVPIAEESHQRFPSHVLVSGGVATTERVSTLKRDDLLERTGRVPRQTMAAIDEALKITLDLE